MILRKGVLKICSKSTGEHPCRIVISIKLQNKNTSGWLLLKFVHQPKKSATSKISQLYHQWLCEYRFTWINVQKEHSVKSIQIRSFFWSVFSRIRTKYGEILLSLCIQSECGKIRTRKNSRFRHFSRCEVAGRFLRKDVCDNFAKFRGYHLPLFYEICRKTRLRHSCFSVNFAKLLRTLFYKTPLGHSLCRSWRGLWKMPYH